MSIQGDLQSRQIKGIPIDSINESIIWKMNLLLLQPVSNLNLHSYMLIEQAPVFRNLDGAIHQINRYPEDNYYDNQLLYPVGSNLSSW